MYYFKYLHSTVRHFWCFRGFGCLIQLVRVNKQSGHRVEFRISKQKSRRSWVGTGFQQGASACKMNASTWIQFPANNSFSFDFKVQWKRCLPWTPYAPTVDLMYFFLDVVCAFKRDPQRNINEQAHHKLWVLQVTHSHLAVYWSLSFLFFASVTFASFQRFIFFFILFYSYLPLQSV